MLRQKKMAIGKYRTYKEDIEKFRRARNQIKEKVKN